MAVEGEVSSSYAYTGEWVKSADRGGLFHTNTSSIYLCAVEVATQALLTSHLRNPHSCNNSLLEKIVENEDVRFHWLMVSVDIPDEVGAIELLQSIVTLWVQIRGFSITSAWLEQYKNARCQPRHRKDFESNCGCQNQRNNNSLILLYNKR